MITVIDKQNALRTCLHFVAEFDVVSVADTTARLLSPPQTRPFTFCLWFCLCYGLVASSLQLTVSSCGWGNRYTSTCWEDLQWPLISGKLGLRYQYIS